MARSLIIDANNILYRIFFAQIKESEDIILGMSHHSALWSMKKLYTKFPADEIVMAFDSYSWRKAYTADLSNCVTHKKYKGTRRSGLTERELEKLKNFDKHVTEFADMLQAQTSLLVLRQKYLEADDLIAGYIQDRPDDEHVLVSADKDYMQLLHKHNLTIIDPESGKPRSLKEWGDDPDYFMFEKCFRGDTSDNVMNAYPRLRATKIKEAYTNEYLRETLMNNEFTTLTNTEDGEILEKSFITRDVFEENRFLMDLECQPDYIRELIATTIQQAIENRGRFSYTAFLKFCRKYDLKNILDTVDNFVPMLAGKRIRQ